jgi:hypothetical protein
MTETSQQRITIRGATLADLEGILAVEQSWPESGRAGADKFIARLTRFPRGFFVAGIVEGGGEKIIATITSMPTAYDPGHPGRYENWGAVTNDGYLIERDDLSGCNGIYIVSGVIEKNYRRFNLFKPGVLKVVAVARRLGLRYVLGGAVLPGFKDYCEQHGETEPYEYCTARRGKQLVDPLLALYESIGFRVPDRRHVIPGYFPDDASRNYAALVVRALEQR